MRDGILVLYKPQGWTSSDCVAVCRRALGVKGIKKVGHGGTLDPMATGVLPVFVGQATRIMEYLELDMKTYVCAARLGISTETLDIWGKVTEEEPWDEVREAKHITKADLAAAVSSFEGEIQQIPPKYSAVRVNGRHLYDYAYKGKEFDVEIKPRSVYVSRISMIDADMEEGQFAFELECSKGTYVRTICSDIGDKLGCGCTMTALERTSVGNIRAEDAKVSAEDVKTMDGSQLEDLLLPVDQPLVHFGKVTMPSDRAAFFRKGNSIWLSQVTVNAEADPEISGRKNARGRDYSRICKVYEEETGLFLGTGYIDFEEGKLKADKVLAEHESI